MMNNSFPSAAAYAAEKAVFDALTVIDIQERQGGIRDPYRNEVLSNVNVDCVRLAVFEEEYLWHSHPDSDEFFLVVAGGLEIDLADQRTLRLSEWQCVVIPSGVLHRTRAIGRTVNLTIEAQGAKTVFVDEPGAK